MKLKLFSTLALVVWAAAAHAFCGFYVAKSDATMYNETSQVILVRSGNQTVVTMSSDFKGEVKDFAMVIPVPEVLSRNQIRITKQEIFDLLEAYSGPRLVEYYDPEPCPVQVPMSKVREMTSTLTDAVNDFEMNEDMAPTVQAPPPVQILESYTVGEYDILILSATESTGLERWLVKNGYKIPSKAAEVLEPYIKNDMKFFVVKVNLEEFAKSESKTLRPIQMTFATEKFMLPIRLGMANAKGDQDMVVYSFSDQGRIETTNYRTVDLPTNKNIPEFVDSKFGKFYDDMFQRAWINQGKNVVFNEYSWDLTGRNPVKCDPCPPAFAGNAAMPFTYENLREMGIFWVTKNQFGGYLGNLHISRLHARYNRMTFPQDLAFQVTPNKTQYQCRYIINRPAKGNMDCENGQQYLKNLVTRRKAELNEMTALTGWRPEVYPAYVREYENKIKNENGWIDAIGKGWMMLGMPGGNSGPGGGMLVLAFILCLGMGWGVRSVMRNRVVFAA